MKIALIETHAVPGTWKDSLALARELDALGALVTIFTAACFPAGVATSGGVWRGFPALHAQPNLLRKGARYLVATGRMVREIRRGGFDVVHWQHFNVLPPIEALTASALGSLRPRLVMTVHDVEPWQAVRMQAAWMLRHTFRSAARLIVHHAANREHLRERFGVPGDHIRVVPRGGFQGFETSPLSRAEARGRIGVPGEGRLVLFFGEIREEKNLPGLIRALALVRRRIPDVRLLAAGRPRRVKPAAVAGEIRQVGLVDAADFRPGYVPDELVEAHFAAADVVALPYRRITQSAVLLQAMTSGRPVVATDGGALGPTVRDAGCGLVVPVDDEAALAEGLVRILTDPELAHRLGERGRQAATSRFTWERSARATWDVYEEVLAS